MYSRPSEISDSFALSEVDDDDSAASIDQFLGQSQQDIARKLNRGKSFNSEASQDSGLISAMEMMYGMDAAEVDEDIHDLNTALGNGNEDFDFRTLNKEELVKMMRGKPTKEMYSNIGKMTKFMHPELARSDREEKQLETRKFKKSQVFEWHTAV